MNPLLTLRDPTFLGSMDNAIPLFDDFNRPNSTDLGTTSVGDRPWQELSGSWSISNNRIVNDSGTNPVAAVDAKTADVDISLDISTGGRDGLVFRASDANNWLRLSQYYNWTSTTTCTDVFEFQRYCWNLNEECEGVFWPTMDVFSCGSCPSCHACYNSSGTCVNTGNVCDTNCTTSTTRIYRVYLHRMVNGSLSTVNFWSGSTTQLRVIANGSSISLFRGTTNIANITETFNQGATLHGVGRSTIGNRSGSALDNFDLKLVE